MYVVIFISVSFEYELCLHKTPNTEDRPNLCIFPAEQCTEWGSNQLIWTICS